jgi:hypothetical protein
MRLRDRVAAFFGRPLHAPELPISVEPLADLPLRRQEATVAARTAREGLTLSPAAGLIDSDDGSFRRLSNGTRFKRRDLSPMQQDRMLEIAWYLWEQNPFARRLITCMTDLVVGEGVGFEAEDPKIGEAAGKVWNHPVNRIADRSRELHDALSLNGELILPVNVNDVSGVPTLGFIDPYQVDEVEPRPDNVMVPAFVRLKRLPNESEGKRIPIIQENPLNGQLEGECFYFAINKLPNSMRGRSDLLALADWLDLFDQYMFAEVERVRLLSAFVWDLEIKDGTPETIRTRLDEIGTPQSGSVFGRNQNEKLSALSPSLNATDRTETARLLTIHIAGSLGMPISWFGWQDSNRATIEGQNDVAMKTPAARQKQFGAFLNAILRYGIEKQRTANPVLFRQLTNDKFGVSMPEIAAKDISRVAGALGQVIGALDTAMQNRTMSRRVATVIQLALTKHLGSGFDFKADDVMGEADADAEERQAHQDELMAKMAAAGGNGNGLEPPPRPGAPRNPPPRTGNEREAAWLHADGDPLGEVREHVSELAGRVRELAHRAPPAPITVNAPITVQPAAVQVEAPQVNVHPPNVNVEAPQVNVDVSVPRHKAVRTLERDPSTQLVTRVIDQDVEDTPEPGGESK